MSHPGQYWMAPTLAMVPKQSYFTKEDRISFLAEAKKARVHFIPDLKVGVFVTLRTPFVIKWCYHPIVLMI
jgi:hypothetical protein